MNNMLNIMFITILYRSYIVICYSNKLFTITKPSVTQDGNMCLGTDQDIQEEPNKYFRKKMAKMTSSWQSIFMWDRQEKPDEDPYDTFQDIVYKFLFKESAIQKNKNHQEMAPDTHNLSYYSTGRALRKAELFNGKRAVHIPIVEMMHRGHCVLNVTPDFMQTAVDAFAIFINGDLTDIQRLPPDYVLNSARTISMLKISHERLAVTWNVVKGTRDPVHVTYETLEKYRPLFKYLNGKEMAKLNLSDQRILNYIGTHPDLNRHQVGLVASKYIKMNRYWSEPKYLNLMNNLLCGVPITFMREIPENTYLQLSHQVFYHTRACDPLQRRFYLGMMTRTQALGKSYSWNAQDVARLGLLLAEVEGGDLCSIKPEALAGLTAQVMMSMRPENLIHLTNIQMHYIKRKPFNILSRKLKTYKDQYISEGFNHRPILFKLILKVIVLLFA